MFCFRSTPNCKKCAVLIHFSVRSHSSDFSRNASPLDYCIQSVRQYDYENFLCTLLLPNSCRTSAFAIRAFNIEIARVQEQTSQPHIGLMRMKFWEETVNNIFSDKVPEHPVARELHRALKRHKMTKRYLMRLINSRSNFLTEKTFRTMQSLEDYCEHSTSSVYYLLLESAGIENIHADHAASHLGKAQGIVNFIRAVPYDARRHMVTLPQDILAQHKVSHESLLRSSHSDSVREVIFTIASQAKQHLDKARSLKETVPKAAKVLFLPAVPIDSYLERLRLSDFNVFFEKLQRKNPYLPISIYWKKLFSQY